MKALIVYGTRYGATTGTSDEIAKVLREEGFEVRVANVKKEKIEDISEYELVIVGSGMRRQLPDFDRRIAAVMP